MLSVYESECTHVRGYGRTLAKGVNQLLYLHRSINHFKLFALMLHLHWKQHRFPQLIRSVHLLYICRSICLLWT